MSQIMRLVKIFLPFTIFIAVAFFLWRGLGMNPRLVPSVLINHETPSFNLPELYHPEKRLSNSIFQGHVSLLNVWATWCVACAEEHPVLVDIANTHLVPIIGLDYKDNRAKAMAYLHKVGDPYQQIGFDATGNMAINWGVYGTPETYVIDKKGVIRYKQIGPITHQIWQQQLWPLIKTLES